MNNEYFNNIPEYSQKREDLTDCYNYILDNISQVDSVEDFDITNYSFEYKESSIDIIYNEATRLKSVYEEIESDKLRIEKIEINMSLDFPVYLYDGEIIAGVHRAIAYLNKNLQTIPIVIIESLGI